jgi:SAM-dependent methyltransferase
MNPGLPDDHGSIPYYDADYPSPEIGRFPENFDDITESQGITDDVARYRELAAEAGGEVLELCCGTGRVAIPLARDGHRVTAVDLSGGMLAGLRDNLAREAEEVRSRLTVLQEDVTELDLNKTFAFAFMAFNSLMCIPDFAGQEAALAAAARHLAPGGLLAVDLVNPLALDVNGDPVAKPFFTRRNPTTGNTYTRFAMMGPIDAEQRQHMHGWYDEVETDGRVRRTHYSMHWRLVYRFEIELMLRAAGLLVRSIEGGHKRESFSAESRKIFALARKA